jgi:hypothetical protein
VLSDWKDSGRLTGFGRMSGRDDGNPSQVIALTKKTIQYVTGNSPVNHHWKARRQGQKCLIDVEWITHAGEIMQDALVHRFVIAAQLLRHDQANIQNIFF